MGYLAPQDAVLLWIMIGLLVSLALGAYRRHKNLPVDYPLTVYGSELDRFLRPGHIVGTIAGWPCVGVAILICLWYDRRNGNEVSNLVDPVDSSSDAEHGLQMRVQHDVEAILIGDDHGSDGDSGAGTPDSVGTSS